MRTRSCSTDPHRWVSGLLQIPIEFRESSQKLGEPISILNTPHHSRPVLRLLRQTQFRQRFHQRTVRLQILVQISCRQFTQVRSILLDIFGSLLMCLLNLAEYPQDQFFYSLRLVLKRQFWGSATLKKFPYILSLCFSM
jgi:hypothetical protein